MGPPTIFETESEPYKAWAKIGPQILGTSPKGLVVVSAHWEAEGTGVQINTDTTNPLVHDFFGFPKKFYALKLKSCGDPQVVLDVKAALAGKVVVNGTKRGLDHGVYFPFMVMFGHENPNLPPVVQVSLPGDGSAQSAARLGEALSSLRDQGYAIIATGQAVHNLRDYMTGQDGSYGAPFLSAMSAAANSHNATESAVALVEHPLFRRAHPTPEHYLPFVVATAAAGSGAKCQEIFTLPDGALGWGSWRWD